MDEVHVPCVEKEDFQSTGLDASRTAEILALEEQPRMHGDFLPFFTCEVRYPTAVINPVPPPPILLFIKLERE